MKLPISLSFETATKEPDRAPRYVIRDAAGKEVGHIWQGMKSPQPAEQIVASVNCSNGQAIVQAIEAMQRCLTELNRPHPFGVVSPQAAKDVLKDFLARVLVIDGRKPSDVRPPETEVPAP